MAATKRSEGLAAVVRLKSPPLTDAHGLDGVPVLKALNQADLERQQWFAERSTFDAQLRGRDEELALLRGQLQLVRQREQEYHAEFAQCKRVLATLQKKANSQQLDMESIFGSAISLLNTEVKKLKIALQDSEGFRSDAEKRLQAQRDVMLTRQKELFQLRELLRDSENKRLYLESLVRQPVKRIAMDMRSVVAVKLARLVSVLPGLRGRG